MTDQPTSFDVRAFGIQRTQRKRGMTYAMEVEPCCSESRSAT